MFGAPWDEHWTDLDRREGDLRAGLEDFAVSVEEVPTWSLIGKGSHHTCALFGKLCTMASSVGPRAKGSDGSDFSHRERVASHYKISAEMKPKLKKILMFQLLCAGMCLSVGLVVRYDFISLLCFFGYACGLPLAFYALKNNSATCINLYGVCCSLLGVFPCAYVVYSSLWTGAVQDYRYVRLALCLPVVLANTLGMFCAKQLMAAWTSSNTARSKKK